ncbi:hypothetical protein PU372_000101 [Salmonella enterica]|uniref:Ead/Ea22-like family protein n=1 Tax=Salmonella enterica subsp. houtenae serovar 48:z4,z32:- TaxID=2577535 RepID=A0A729IWD4_SALHO|nr:hypothetical protein [Salmonella enterica subsp. houtenae]EAQ6165440.1 hypothetical protein [Salmonella enterica]EKR1447267.1 hypothetical protein [Salmonella enterica subsp. houtenae serovar 48:z4,z32:-]EAX4519002.1 hypothetical protein [Salmonella enterica]EDV1453054.1 hypothetical protein [Salmonella enterica subsp. houtenae]
MESMAEGMIKDLVASGHALADDMTGAPSVLVRCLAAQLEVQLEVQLVRANALAAENAGLKAAKEIIRHLNVNREEANFCGIDDCYIDDAVAAMITPATDAFLAEVRASARNEGINYAASRLAAAFNHGFLNKPVSEVLDVTRMILSAKEDLANDPLPAADGLSGEYAEKSIEELVAQLRQETAQ